MTQPTSIAARQESDRQSPDATVLPASSIPARFELVACAGHGAFCDLWQAYDPATEQLLAIKQLRPAFRDQPVGRTLLENERQIGRRLKSRYIVRSLGGEIDHDPPYILLEWLTGRTLEQELGTNAPLPIRRALWIARQCAQGLCDLERAGYAHGDVKPSNIFITSGGGLKLIDLGFARALDDAGSSPLDEMLTGTPEYLAPESLSRENFGPVVKDVYSLGVTLFRMLTGRLPFAADSSADVLLQQREFRPPLLRHWCPEASQPLTDLVRRLLAKHPVRRPANLRDLVQELIDLELAAFPCRSELSA